MVLRLFDLNFALISLHNTIALELKPSPSFTYQHHGRPHLAHIIYLFINWSPFLFFTCQHHGRPQLAHIIYLFIVYSFKFSLKNSVRHIHIFVLIC